MDRPILPPNFILDPWLTQWLREDLGRGDRTTQALFSPGASPLGVAEVRLKQSGVIAGLPIALRVFELLDPQIIAENVVSEGGYHRAGDRLATVTGPVSVLLSAERVALNLLMRLSGIATLTQAYQAKIADLSAQLVDTRKTTPGLRVLEKYAIQVGGGKNHRFGLDDALMLKDNHIAAAGGLGPAIAQVRQSAPYPLSLEVETETLDQVQEAVSHGADIIMLDNMTPDLMRKAVQLIRIRSPQTKIEASGNVTLENIRTVAQTGVDFISTSAPITQATWLDISLKFLAQGR
ncbi:carboxylating nicotinate-nucleotide diphosphorylase [Lyngbya confervoides]|uniref:Probable nicotinate-nucleotide pyrophosphorylase [carboxylating] n=1 Tax=Lyngbya confervoides BDU141951 TaxID=1574623 RepID=A0ABD4T4I9_9CYAN|nr:carboxylating nicotinate-nucleotide diphosphorylase [Lyngbya confervoides]MCM1983351.1 carboxylating nicotinate-nucleotide diphosphorylase [Lyngbya confervoides BDU141951]